MVFEHDFDRYPELTNSQLQEYVLVTPHKQITEDFSAVIVKVHDGDTVTLRADFRDFDFPMRLLDIDAPELNEGGQEAKQWLEKRILNKQVRIIIDSKMRVGKYGRLLGKIFDHGLDAGQEMLHLGLVHVFGKKDEGQIPSQEKLFRLNQWV